MVNQDQQMIATFRAHANFNEYVPITLILMGLAIVLHISAFALAVLCIFFVLGRYVHAFALIYQESEGKYSGRIFGMANTLTVILILAIYDLVSSIAQMWLVVG